MISMMMMLLRESPKNTAIIVRPFFFFFSCDYCHVSNWLLYCVENAEGAALMTIKQFPSRHTVSVHGIETCHLLVSSTHAPA